MRQRVLPIRTLEDITMLIIVIIIATVVVTLAAVHFFWCLSTGDTVVTYMQKVARVTAYVFGSVAAMCLVALAFLLIFGAPVAWLQDNFGETTGEFYQSQLGLRIVTFVVDFWFSAVVTFVAAALGGMFGEDGSVNWKPNWLTKKQETKEG